MLEGFSETEIAELIDALQRRAKTCRPERPDPVWTTLSGFADADIFQSALARSWPVFPRTGDFLALQKLFRLPAPVMLNASLVRAIPSDELL